MTGRRVVIAGGGEQAAQKCRLILKTEAQITILAHTLDDELESLVKEGRSASRRASSRMSGSTSRS
ncbi:MAG: NAD(P)-dependent oxidoreductase [Pseudomonadota bacterium]